MRSSGRVVVAVALSVVALVSCSGSSEKKKPITTSPKVAEKSNELLEFEPSSPSEVKVDLAKPVAVKAVNGILSGVSTDKPDDEVLKAVSPIQVRGWTKTVPTDRVEKLPARWILLLSDSWGYPSENYPNGAGKAPFEDEVGWDTKVGEQVRPTFGHPTVLYEPWSAPDVAEFFNGTEDQANRVWLLAYAATRREIGPNAYMVGPSISSYDPDRITRFLEFCLNSGCQVDVLSWQELVSAPGDIDQITVHLNDARERFLKNPRYARLGIKEINITEYGSPDDQYRPGETVAYLNALEAGHADGAGRSCFAAPGGGSNCYNGTMNAMLGPKSGKPNGVWFVMAGYWATLAGRVASTFNPGLPTIAGKTAGGKSGVAEAIVGNSRSPSVAKPEKRSPIVEFSSVTAIPALATATKVVVNVRIVNVAVSGELGDSKFLEATVPVENGVVRVKVPDLPPGSAAIVTVLGP